MVSDRGGLRVLVTGGAGYIGWSLVSHLVKRSDVVEVRVFDNLSASRGFLSEKTLGSNAKVTLFEGDVLDRYALREALREISVVYHLAALVPSLPTSFQENLWLVQVNQWGTEQLVAEVEQANVELFVYLGSVASYGFHGQVVTSSSDPRPSNAYGESKLLGEHRVSRLSPGVDCAIVRAGTVFGRNPVTRFDSLINRLGRNYRGARPTVIEGDGSVTYPLVELETLATYLVELLDRNSFSGEVENVVSQNWTLGDIFMLFKTVATDAQAVYVETSVESKGLTVGDTLASESKGKTLQALQSLVFKA